MNVKHRIIHKNLVSGKIVVRFFTDLITEASLASIKDPVSFLPVEFASDGSPLNCITDVAIEIPFNSEGTVDEAEVTKSIARACRWDWFEKEERILRAQTIPDPLLISLSSAIESLPTSTGTLVFNQEPTLEEKKKLMWDKIKEERTRRTQTGGVKVGDNWYDIDTFSRTQIMGMVLMGANLPANIDWKTKANAFVRLTPTLVSQIFGAAAMSDVVIFAAAEAHRSAMEALGNPLTYDFSQGWPEKYEPPVL